MANDWWPLYSPLAGDLLAFSDSLDGNIYVFVCVCSVSVRMFVCVCVCVLVVKSFRVFLKEQWLV